MKFTKRLLAAFCLVLCLASAGWCVDTSKDPFKVNSGGFGLNIRGLQLGMKMSLLDLAELGTLLGRWPFFLRIQGKTEGDWIQLKFLGRENRISAFEVVEAKGSFSGIESARDTLENILAEIENAGVIGAGYKLFEWDGSYRIHLRKGMRVDEFGLDKNDFDASDLTNEEFVRGFMEVYSIPVMKGERKRNGFVWVTEWNYINNSEGWRVTFSGLDSGVGVVRVRPWIITSVFD